MNWYFAYGSNMSARRLFDERLMPQGVARTERIAGRLDGWRLVFNKRARAPEGAGAANIVPAAGAVVHGTVSPLTERGFAILDHHEGVAGGHYARHRVTVVRGDGRPVEAITYVALRLGEGLRPTRGYLGHLLAARDLLPDDYWQALAATPTCD